MYNLKGDLYASGYASSPTVTGGLIYVGSFEENAKLYAFDATCCKDCQPR
jgi:PQQ-like domain